MRKQSKIKEKLKCYTRYSGKRKDKMKTKWIKTEKFSKYLGEKYYYAFIGGLLLITSESLTIALKVKDLATVKKIVELLEK